MENEIADPLSYLRRAMERARAAALEPISGQDPAVFESVGIVGAGIMGAAIAAIHLERLVPVTLVDAAPEALPRAKASIQDAIAAGPLGHEAGKVADALLTLSTYITALAGCDLVIESIVEKSAAKQSLLKQVEPLLSPNAVIASNTSTIPIARLAMALYCPERFCGIHFCHPIPIRPLVEVISGPKTSDLAARRAARHIAQIGQLPIAVADGHGFVVNRLLLTYLGEGLAMLADGYAAAAIGEAARLFGMASGPLEMIDRIGLDTALQSGVIMSEVASERMADMRLLVTLVKAGDLGEKRGCGVYIHPSLDVNPRVLSFLSENPPPRIGQSFGNVDLADRLILPMVLEAVRIVEQGQVSDPCSVDLAAVFGLGFPATRGGPLAWADQMGASVILDRLATMPELGERGRPPQLLRDLAASGRSISS